jgi:hypothetical protein
MVLCSQLSGLRRPSAAHPKCGQARPGNHSGRPSHAIRRRRPAAPQHPHIPATYVTAAATVIYVVAIAYWLFARDDMTARTVISSKDRTVYWSTAAFFSLHAIPLTIRAGRRLVLNISCGHALFPEDVNSPHNLIHQADAAMYMMKRKTRPSIAAYT